MASNCFSGAYRVLFFLFGGNAWCLCDLILSLALLCPAWFCSPCCCPNKQLCLLALVFCNTRGVRQITQVLTYMARHSCILTDNPNSVSHSKQRHNAVCFPT